jgi:membrane dipeptidase
MNILDSTPEKKFLRWKTPMIIVDAHQDLAWNILSFGRDYTRSAAETREQERGTQVPVLNGDTLLGWPDYQKGLVAVVFSTLFASPVRSSLGEWDSQSYANEDEAFALYQAQLDAYYRLVDQHPDKFRLVKDQGDLKEILDHWQNQGQADHPVGLVPLMEGAEGVRHPSELEAWWQRGVRIIGPAWTGTRFCGGTREPGPLTRDGFALLDAMSSIGFILDISHMDELAVLQSLDEYHGRILASHANAKALLRGTDSNRNLSNRVIQGVIERDGVIGVVPFNRFLVNGWRTRDGRESVSLVQLIDHIDHICQLAGDAQHVGIGSDFDGGFGLQKTPFEIDTIADLQKLIPLLDDKGYTEKDIEAVLSRNWIDLLSRSLPGR